MIALVGSTGFVGSNIYEKGKIDKAYHSKNIEDAYGTKPDLLIYAGMRAEKYLANTNPEKDMELVYQAEKNIEKIDPKKLVLISTIDVFKNPCGKDEDSKIDETNLHAYGLNRYKLEQWVRKYDQDTLIIRLPGLYGINIKKNFIYDYIHVIPFMLKKDKFKELSERDTEIKKYYKIQKNGFYQCRDLNDVDRVSLKAKFKKLHFTALNFTDSRNVYQFYPLARLWDDIQIAVNNQLRLWHPATEPVCAAEIYQYLTGMPFVNEITEKPVTYNYKTKYAFLFGGRNGYLMEKGQVLTDIKSFVRSCMD